MTYLEIGEVEAENSGEVRFISVPTFSTTRRDDEIGEVAENSGEVHSIALESRATRVSSKFRATRVLRRSLVSREDINTDNSNADAAESHVNKSQEEIDGDVVPCIKRVSSLKDIIKGKLFCF